MSELRDQYFRTLGISEDQASKHRLFAALDRAYQLRSFEIEHYWKRATYFWGFQIAIFAALGLVWKETIPTSWSPITIALSGVGILTALANTLSAHGSKFWQQNWEMHIDMLEDDIEGRLHKTVWLREGRTSFSVSRINQSLSYFFITFWVIVFVYTSYKSLDFTSIYSVVLNCYNYAYVLFILVMVVVGVFILFCQRSDLDGTTPKSDGSHGAPIEQPLLCNRKSYGYRPPTFVRRFAPDEKPKP